MVQKNVMVNPSGNVVSKYVETAINLAKENHCQIEVMGIPKDAVFHANLGVAQKEYVDKLIKVFPESLYDENVFFYKSEKANLESFIVILPDTYDMSGDEAFNAISLMEEKDEIYRKIINWLGTIVNVEGVTVIRVVVDEMAGMKKPVDQEVITRENLYEKLLEYGVEHNLALEVSEFVRKGKAQSKKNCPNNCKDNLVKWSEYRRILAGYNVSEEIIEFCERVEYLPKRG